MKSILVSIALIALLFLGSCSTEREEIRYVDFKVWDPVYVAVDKGFFDKAGVDVVLTGSVLGGPTAIQAVSAGKADAGLSSIPAIINANQAGLPIIGLTDMQSALPSQPLEKYFVKKDSGIKTVEDTKDKLWAVNLWRSSFHYTAKMELGKHDMEESDVNFLLMSFDKQVQAFLAGSIDVASLMEPYGAQLAAKDPDAVILFDALDTFGAKQFTLHFMNRIWVEENPKKTEKFVKGIVDAMNWIEENQDEAREIMSKYLNVEYEFVPEYHFQENGAVIMEDVQFWIDYMTDIGDLKDVWIWPEDIASNAYNEALR